MGLVSSVRICEKYWNLATIVQGAKKNWGMFSRHAEWPKVADAVIKAEFAL
jgi:hypothetical protein